MTTSLGAAVADDLEEYKSRQQTKLDSDSADVVNGACKAKISAKFNWKSLGQKMNEYAEGTKQIHYKCTDPLEYIASVCKSGPFGSSVRAQIKSYECRYGKTASVSLKEGTLIATFDWNKGVTNAWLEENVDALLRDGNGNDLALAKYLLDQTRMFNASVEQFQSTCKSKAPARIDWPSFGKDVKANRSNSRRELVRVGCATPLKMLTKVCIGSSPKSVPKKVKSYVCTSGKKGRVLKIKKGALKYQINFSAKENRKGLGKFYTRKGIAPRGTKFGDGASTLSKVVEKDSKKSPKAKCRSGCRKRCKAAKNKSKCISKCKDRCSK